MKEFEENNEWRKRYLLNGINSTLYWAYVNSKVTEKEEY